MRTNYFSSYHFDFEKACANVDGSQIYFVQMSQKMQLLMLLLGILVRSSGAGIMCA
jgi:hypothetical protein